MENKIISFDKISKCSHCGKDLHFKLYPIFNLQDLTEEEFTNLFELKTFKIECEQCKKTTIVQYDTIVVDMYKKYIIYVYTSGSINSFKASTADVISKMFKLDEKMTESFKTIKNFRIVTNLNDMLEKMLIFDYDLDDRVIVSLLAWSSFISLSSSCFIKGLAPLSLLEAFVGTSTPTLAFLLAGGCESDGRFVAFPFSTLFSSLPGISVPRSASR